MIDKENSTLALFEVDKSESIQKSLQKHHITLWSDIDQYDFDLVCEFDTIIMSAHMVEFTEEDNLQLQKEILQMIENGGHVCILCDNATANFDLITEILAASSIKIIELSKAYVEYDVIRSEFTEYLRKHAIISCIFSSANEINSPICTLRVSYPAGLHKDEKSVGGFTTRKGKGMITILPLKPTFGLFDEIEGILLVLNKALETHRKNFLSFVPDYVSEIKLPGELDLEKQVRNLRNQIGEKNILLDRQREQKSILWLKHDELRDKCRLTLSKLGIRSLEEDNGEEDFWIVDGNGSKIVICESKGKDHNLKREDLSKFDEHREARDKTEDFPALLLVNSYNTANNLKEKDQPIPSNVIQKAVKLNMLIIRTIDLIRLFQLIHDKIVTSENILSYFTSKNGWMKVTETIEFIVR